MVPELTVEEASTLDAANAKHANIVEFFRTLELRTYGLICNAIDDGSSRFEKAVQGLYFRAYYFLATVTKLDYPEDIQSTWAIVRSLFEIHVELTYLLAHPELGDQFHDFNRIERMEFFKNRKNLILEDPELAQRLKGETPWVDDQEKVEWCERMKLQYYKSSKCPSHWTGMRFAELLRVVVKLNPGDKQFRRFQVASYKEASWHIHGGGVAFGGAPRLKIIDDWGRSLAIAQHEMYRITEITIAALRLTNSEKTEHE